MTRLLVLSDLHLEFDSGYRLPPIDKLFDVAVFAGDVHHDVGKALDWIARERDHGAIAGRPVVYVTGNHEFYHGEIGPAPTLPEADRAAALDIHLLSPGTIVIGETRFVGATLWTDYGLLGDARRDRGAADALMNDHKLIRWREGLTRRRFTSSEALRLHRRDRAFIDEQLALPFAGPTVVVTHHAPHPGSIAPRHRGSALSPAFASDISDLILRHGPELWVHGHDHASHDYLVGATRVLANQAGYPTHFGTRENPHFDPGLVVEVGRGGAS